MENSFNSFDQEISYEEYLDNKSKKFALYITSLPKEEQAQKLPKGFWENN